ncbi:hypothetical protein [Mycolicibacter heraklionensis]|nr:hypothetical protein [Mycolicibacter heraklionensis]
MPAAPDFVALAIGLALWRRPVPRKREVPPAPDFVALAIVASLL